MLDLESTQVAVIAGALLVYSLAVPIPGPSFVYITKSAMSQGVVAGALAAIGTTLAAAVYATGALLGLSVLLSAQSWLLDLIRIAGGFYLSYIGMQVLLDYLVERRSSTSKQWGSSEGTHISEMSSNFLCKGFLVALGNPKMAVFFLSLFSPAIGVGNEAVTRIIILFGILFIDFFYHQALARFVFVVSRSQSMRLINQWLDVAAGSIMTIFGVALVIQEIARIYRS